MRNFRQHRRNDLDAARAISNNCNSFALGKELTDVVLPLREGDFITHAVVIALIPFGAMQKLSLEVV
jgi:hypothetical protein